MGVMLELAVPRRNLRFMCPVGMAYTVLRARRVMTVPPVCHVFSHRVVLSLCEDHAIMLVYL